jgi:hypothetical protein
MLLGPALRDLTNSRAADVVIVDTNGDQLTTFDVNVTNPSIPITFVAPTTATITSPALSTTDTVILAANGARKKYSIYNDTGSKIYVALGSVTTTTNFSYILAAGTYYESSMNDYTGAIHAIKASGTGPVRVTEFT